MDWERCMLRFNTYYQEARISRCEPVHYVCIYTTLLQYYLTTFCHCLRGHFIRSQSRIDVFSFSNLIQTPKGAFFSLNLLGHKIQVSYIIEKLLLRLFNNINAIYLSSIIIDKSYTVICECNL